jgi:hypothetical protein
MPVKFHCVTSGLYYKHTTIINYASSVVNKLGALLTDNARVIIYDCHVFIVQATEDFKKVVQISEKVSKTVIETKSLNIKG